MKVQVHVPDGMKISEVAAMARSIGCRVKCGPSGALHFTPTATGNATVVKIPRYHRQNIMHREHE